MCVVSVPDNVVDVVFSLWFVTSVCSCLWMCVLYIYSFHFLPFIVNCYMLGLFRVGISIHYIMIKGSLGSSSQISSVWTMSHLLWSCASDRIPAVTSDWTGYTNRCYSNARQFQEFLFSEKLCELLCNSYGFIMALDGRIWCMHALWCSLVSQHFFLSVCLTWHCGKITRKT